MIIDVKGTKTGGGEAASRPTYALKEARLSQAPFVIGAMILGVAAYLKSAMPSWGRLPPEEAPLRPEEAGEPRMRLVDTPLLAALPEPDPAGPEDDRPRRAGSGTPFDGRLDPPGFLGIDEPTLHFPDAFTRTADVSALAHFQGTLLVANDNIASAGQGHGGGTGGGGTGGDGTPPAGGEPPVVDRPPGRPPSRDDDGEDPRPVANRAPRVAGPVYLPDVAGCAIVLFGLSDLLAKASDPDGDVLSIRNLQVSSGSIAWTGSGFLYDPSGLGPVTVTYEITDGRASVVQHAYFSVVRTPITGTDGDDLLLGTACADAIEGRGGDDLIDGRGGDDHVEGGAGDDHVLGGAGSDVLRGGQGNDVILGGAGDDQISGGAGDDRLFGDDGNDIVFGDGGHDQIRGGAGSDMLFGGDGHDTIGGDAGDDRIDGQAGDDVLEGGDGADVVAGGDGHDRIDGGAGNDLLIDGEGRDTVSGGAGDDHVTVARDGAQDRYDGGAGIDTLDLAHSQAGVAVDLEGATACGREIGRNEVAGFEAVRGGTGDDTLAGSAGHETLAGGEGDDSLHGRGGHDRLEGGEGDDLISDGEGRDTVSGGAGNDRVCAGADRESDVYDGGDGCDTLDYSASEAAIVVDLNAGTARGADIGNDRIGGFETVIGGAGDDHIVAGSQPVVVGGGAGDDIFEFTAPVQSGPAVTILHAIVDFEAGDRIRMSKYDLFEKVFDRLENQFESIYGDVVDENEALIRYRHEKSESIDRTVIEADLDRDRIYETTIHLDGHRAIVIVEHA